MSVLAVFVPPRARANPAAAEPTAWRWLLCADGRSQPGSGTPAEWPAADELVALLAEDDVAWLPATLPRASPARLPQALMGLLEDQLLDEAVQFALAPGALAGQPTFVAVIDKPWLGATLQALQAAGRPAERVLPLLRPGCVPAQGHFTADPAEASDPADPGTLRLAWSDERGAAWLGTAGPWARSLAEREGARWSAAPACAGAAQQWLGGPVAALAEGDRVLQVLAEGWNLLQFDLAPRRHGRAGLRNAWRQFLAPAWRPVHLGLLALAALNLLGLNAWAWQQQRALGERRQAMVELLRQTHPQVRAILDPALQMGRETERLRQQAGQPGDDDLETLLAVAAAVWPPQSAAVDELRFEPGRLVLAIDGWDAAQIDAVREQLAPAGWQVSVAGSELSLQRAREGGPR